MSAKLASVNRPPTPDPEEDKELQLEEKIRYQVGVVGVPLQGHAGAVRQCGASQRAPGARPYPASRGCALLLAAHCQRGAGQAEAAFGGEAGLVRLA